MRRVPTPTDAAGSSDHDHHHGRLLDDHRRAAFYGILLFVALLFMLFGVGKHPTALAPETTVAAIGRLDARVYDAIEAHRSDVLTALFKVFDWTGKGIVTIPLRIALLAVLLARRRFAAGIAFALTWASSEIVLETMKLGFMRGRPPSPLVATVGYSFPSGHATAGAAIGVSIVLAFMRPGPRRRRWTLIAVLLAFAMAFSRVYLGAHWLSDVVTGVLLGSTAAVLSFAIVDEVRQRTLRRGSPAQAGSAAT
jgi:membrane-associated phospholipid phosphatase